MGLVYKDLMGKMGIDDEGLFELAYCELDYISNDCLLYTLRAHETDSYLVCRLLLEKKKKKTT